MTDEFEYREVEVDEEPPEEVAQWIVDQIDVDLDVDSLARLLHRTRHVYREALGDWLRRNDPDWQPPRHPKANVDPYYDYGDMAGVGFDDRWVDRKTGKEYFGWDAWYQENWGRAQGNPGRFRGTDIAMQPLVWIYFQVNRWWRDTTGRTFNPDFGAQYSADTDDARFPHLKPDAQIFLLVAQDSDRRYNCNLCGRVHDKFYRQLDRSFKSSE